MQKSGVARVSCLIRALVQQHAHRSPRPRRSPHGPKSRPKAVACIAQAVVLTLAPIAAACEFGWEFATSIVGAPKRQPLMHDVALVTFHFPALCMCVCARYSGCQLQVVTTRPSHDVVQVAGGYACARCALDVRPDRRHIASQAGCPIPEVVPADPTFAAVVRHGRSRLQVLIGWARPSDPTTPAAPPVEPAPPPAVRPLDFLSGYRGHHLLQPAGSGTALLLALRRHSPFARHARWPVSAGRRASAARR